MEISIGSYKFSFRLEILLLAVILYFILFGHLIWGCSKGNLLEGFTSFGRGSSEYSTQFQEYKLGDNTQVDTSRWYYVGQNAQEVANRPKQPVPLPEGEMLMFKDTEFKMECCPSGYATRSGCACMTSEQANYLATRFGNKPSALSEY